MSDELRQAADTEHMERLAWNLAGCLTIAESGRPTTYSEEMALPALRAVNDMAARLEACERDAARYRWLRERRILRVDIYVSLHHPPDANGKAVDHPHGAELDAVIDTAMQGEQNP